MHKQNSSISNKEIVDLMRFGIKHETEHIKVFFAKDRHFGLSVVVPKKVAEKAVTRNYIKRKIKEAIKTVFKNKEKQKLKTVIIAKNKTKTTHLKILEKEISEILDSAINKKYN